MVVVSRVKRVVDVDALNHLMERIRIWFESLAGREQRLVLFAAIAVPVLILIFGIWLPLQDRAEMLRQERGQLESQLKEAEILAASLEQSPKRNIQGSLLATLDSLARQAGIRQQVTQLRPQVVMGGSGEKVLVQIKDTPFDILARFLSLLGREGVGLERIAISASSGGKVNVRITANR